MFRLYALAALLACSILAAQDSRETILAASRSGIVELIDPATLATVARMHFRAGPVGLNGISASRDGSSLYVEGPIPGDPKACCVLYSVELATLQVKLAASIPGSRSRNSLVISDGLVYDAATIMRNEMPKEMSNERLHLSPDGRWLFGVKSFQGPALDLYDIGRRQVVRRLTAEGLKGDWWPSGAWSGNRFYLYANDADGTGRLWAVSPESTQLGPGETIAPFGSVSGCSNPSPRGIAASGGALFIYEEFGFKVDRRNSCKEPVPGGAWMIDPAKGTQARQIAPTRHFSVLFTNLARSELHGLNIESPNWDVPAELVRMDPRDGRILQTRHLDRGFWRVAMAPLRVVPSGDLHPNGFIGF
ncbi:MAG: hypothetical protein ABSH09_04040 [Bryobacteraceae bacterium]